MSWVNCGRRAQGLRAAKGWSLSGWQSNTRGLGCIYAEHPRVGELGARSIIAEGALKAVSASARRSAQRGLEAVQAAVAATKAGHEAAAVHAAVADKTVFPSWDPGRRWSPRCGISTESRGWHLQWIQPRAAKYV